MIGPGNGSIDYNDVPDYVNDEYVDDYNNSEDKEYIDYEDYANQRSAEDYGY